VEHKPLRVVFAGYGQRGEYLARRLAAEKWCRVVAVADPDPAALQRAMSLHQVSTFTDFDKLLAATSADVAVISTPRPLLHDYALAARGAGMQVLLAQSPHAPVKGATILDPAPDFLARWRKALGA
jgi:predicted dehydrogenase